MNDFEYISYHTNPVDAVCQLAEEASELAKAALKLSRVIRGTNPTPVTYEQAVDRLFEEIADVNVSVTVMLDVLGERYDRVPDTEADKIIRWAERLREYNGEQSDS